MGKENTAAKRARRRARKKELKREQREEEEKKAEESGQEQEVDVEYVREDLVGKDPLAMEFVKVFERFAQPEVVEEESKGGEERKKETGDEEMEMEGEELGIETEQLSKRKLKELTRLSVAELKQLVLHPEVVDLHDCHSTDPPLLVHLKAYRNTVPVPMHWSQKRKYLQGKRGIVKPPFALPPNIAATGITDIREAQLAQDEEKKLKQKQRERLQPKMGRLDIDYKKLHDAFFVHPYVPKWTGHGDLYHEGKEFEVSLKKKTPGTLSRALREALGLPDGYPPPWLINMQRFGPPPSYRALKIPGLNAPLPPGASYGYGEGQWGKPPVDQFGQPLYGNPFDPPIQPIHENDDMSFDAKELWGELLPLELEEEQEASEDESVALSEDEEEPVLGEETPALSGIYSTESSFAATPLYPGSVELRKSGVESSTPAPQLYQELKQTSSSVGNALMGSSHTYVMPTAVSGSKHVAQNLDLGHRGVQVALDPDQLDRLDGATVQKRYQEELEAVKATSAMDAPDLDDLAASGRKRKRKSDDSHKKKFKF